MTVLERDDDTHPKKKEDLRNELRRLEQPHIKDMETALKQALADGLLGRGLSNRERLTALRGFCEMARAQLWIHALECRCKVPDSMQLTAETLDEMGVALEGIVVPPMQYHDERDRAAGLIRSYFEVPDVGQQYQSSSQPERQPYLAERTQEDYAHRILNEDMMRMVSSFIAMLQVHGILKWREEEPSFNLTGVLGKPPVLSARPPLPPELAAKLAERAKAAPAPTPSALREQATKKGGDTA